MNFNEVIQACLDFSIANGGTIQSCSVNAPDRLQVQSRTTRVAIFVDRDPVVHGHWRVQLLQNAEGNQEQPRESVTVSSIQDLLACLAASWQ